MASNFNVQCLFLLLFFFFIISCTYHHIEKKKSNLFYVHNVVGVGSTVMSRFKRVGLTITFMMGAHLTDF